MCLNSGFILSAHRPPEEAPRGLMPQLVADMELFPSISHWGRKERAPLGQCESRVHPWSGHCGGPGDTVLKFAQSGPQTTL